MTYSQLFAKLIICLNSKFIFRRPSVKILCLCVQVRDEWIRTHEFRFAKHLVTYIFDNFNAKTSCMCGTLFKKAI